MKKLIIVLTLILLLVGCGDPVPEVEKGESYIDLGDNIFWIDKTDMGFVKSLKLLKHEHPDLKIVSVTGKGTGSYGTDIGFYVICEER